VKKQSTQQSKRFQRTRRLSIRNQKRNGCAKKKRYLMAILIRANDHNHVMRKLANMRITLTPTPNSPTAEPLEMSALDLMQAPSLLPFKLQR